MHLTLDEFYRKSPRCITVIYDLSDPEAWEAALRVRKAYGRQHSEIEVLDSDHIAIVCRPGSAQELSR